jgi:hypothetical protein
MPRVRRATQARACTHPRTHALSHAQHEYVDTPYTRTQPTLTHTRRACVRARHTPCMLTFAWSRHPARLPSAARLAGADDAGPRTWPQWRLGSRRTIGCWWRLPPSGAPAHFLRRTPTCSFAGVVRGNQFVFRRARPREGTETAQDETACVPFKQTLRCDETARFTQAQHDYYARGVRVSMALHVAGMTRRFPQLILGGSRIRKRKMTSRPRMCGLRRARVRCHSGWCRHCRRR